MNVLVNDGMSAVGGKALEAAGYTLFTQKVPQEKLVDFMNEKNIEILLVRSATQVPQELIEAVPGLKLIGRGGIGMDNIDVAYAKEMGLHVINTPTASLQSVAELVFAHLFGLVRKLHDANRNMPLEGDRKFSQLKKSYAGAIELKGKTLGIVGYGRIGRFVAKIAYGLGLKVVGVKYDHEEDKDTVKLDFYDGQSVTFDVPLLSFDEVLSQSDFITLHVPRQEDYLINEATIAKMKDGVVIVNAARGGVVDEVALVKALDSGKVSSAALDVFEKEPTPEISLLMHPNISLSPHVGGSTKDAQERIGLELADQIVEIFGKQ